MSSQSASRSWSTNRDLFAAVPLDEPGTPASHWQTAAANLPPLDPNGIAHALVVVAHPDDECLGAGGLTHALTTRGTPVQAVIVSGGQKSHAHRRDVDPAELESLRREESTAAAEVLGAEPPQFLGFPDGGLEDHTAEIVTALKGIFEQAERENGGIAPTVITHWRGDGHPDHEAVGRCAVAAARRLARTDGRDDVDAASSSYAGRVFEFPLWALHWDSPRGGQFPIAKALAGEASHGSAAKKAQAVGCCTTQMTAWPSPSESPVMPLHVVQRLLEVPELFMPSGMQTTIPSAAEYGAGAPEEVEPVDGLDHLEGLYASSADPWDLETSAYEESKRQATLGALPRRRYRFCFEVGSSVGVLTAQLAQRADRLVGWEPVEIAARQAQERISGLERAGELSTGAVSIESRALSAVYRRFGPAGADLVVLSEVLYFIPHDELAPIISGLCQRAAPDAHLVAVHWRYPVAGWPDGGAGTHAALADEPRLRRIHRASSSPDYLIEVFEISQPTGGGS